MPEPDDHQLLAEYARTASEPAFATLVGRYVNLVYSTAWRSTGNPHQAEEITQAVFIILARKGPGLSRRVVLSGWLYRVARFTAANFLKGENRRRRREQEAYMQSTLNESPADTWQHLAPLLDEAMDRLGQTDRDALVLRYFENKTAAEIGAVLRLNEETARKRVNRGLEKLHRYLARRGMISSAGAVGLAISAHSVQPAPAGLEQTVISVAAVKGSGATAATLTLVKHTLNYMIWSKLISALAIGAAVLLTAGTATLLAQPQDENPLNGGRISYKMLDDACRLVESVDQSKFIFHVLLESKNHNLHPADIHLTIDSKVKGAIPLQLNTNWEMLNFPHDPELRRENPRIQSGQPKGSMNVTVMTLLPKPDGLAFPYRRLGEELDEVNRVIGLANGIILAGYSGELSPYKTKARTAIFQFPRTQTGKAKIEIAAAAGKKELVADRNGRIRLTLDESLLKENPQVTLSEAPRFIVPDLPHP